MSRPQAFKRRMAIDHLVNSDYDHARRKALWRRVIMSLTRRRNELLRFDQVRQQLRAQGRHAAGSRQVPVDAVVGSVGRYHDFDAAFLPRRAQTRPRWLSIDRAHHEEVSLPPVELYKLGETYFVKDGNHRVSVARERGQAFVDAYVIEVQSPVPITCLSELEEWLENEDAVEFLAATRLMELRPQANVCLTLCGQYEKLLEHIAVHRWFMGIELQREVGYDEAVASWYDRVYVPVVEGLRETELQREFPKRTEADLYLWLIEHLWYLREAGELDDGASLAESARTHAARLRPPRRLARILRSMFARRAA